MQASRSLVCKANKRRRKERRIQKISIDIETFSDIDLVKCGVYKYADSPAFEILLFAYSIDGGEIHIIDLASGD